MSVALDDDKRLVVEGGRVRVEAVVGAELREATDIRGEQLAPRQVSAGCGRHDVDGGGDEPRRTPVGPDDR